MGSLSEKKIGERESEEYDKIPGEAASRFVAITCKDGQKP